MTFALTTPKEAEALLSKLFAASLMVKVKVSENKAFKDNGWLELGTMKLDPGGGKPSHLITAIRRGAFEWVVSPAKGVEDQLVDLLGLKEADRNGQKLRRAMDAISATAMRLGLRYPQLDPTALERMPFKRSTTIVADTSAIIQGGLDFIVRHLHPAARIKVPAIAQMEIVNFSDRFLSTRRALRLRATDLLIDHILSQGGQRVLLRLELNTDTEIERNFLLGDPLRNAFQKDSDPEIQDLNLNVRIKAYADRLILESARQHQAQSNLGHKVQLLTSDQGLARMALSEGIVPTYFSSVVAEDFFGKRLTGINLDPFSGKLRECSIASVLWELATAFGSARLESDTGDAMIEVAAFGEGLSWSPVHSHADLLWCDHKGGTATPAIPPQAGDSPQTTRSGRPGRKKLSVLGGAANKPKEATAAERNSTPQRFNVSNLLALIDNLDAEQKLSDEDVIKLTEVRNLASTEEYSRFLRSGDLISVDNSIWTPKPGGTALAIALRNEDITQVLQILRRVPSFDEFASLVQACPTGSSVKPGAFERAFNTYRTLGEITLLCALVYNEGVYPTPNSPNAADFASVAITQFKALDNGDGLVSTGAWLERLIKVEGIHPEIARVRLDDASHSKLLRRSTEGSTPDIRNGRHVLQVLRSKSGHPVIEQVHLYRGDYLIPGKASTSLRILEQDQ